MAHPFWRNLAHSTALLSWRYLFLGVGALFLLLLLTKSFVIILLFLGVNALLALLLRPFKFFLAGIELATLSTLVLSVLYGPKVGLVVGALSVLINYLALSRVSGYMFISIAVYALVGMILPFVSFLSITVLGILFTLLFNLLVMPLLIFLGANPVKSMSYILINIVFNITLFISFAPELLHLLH